MCQKMEILATMYLLTGKCSKFISVPNADLLTNPRFAFPLSFFASAKTAMASAITLAPSKLTHIRDVHATTISFTAILNTL